MRTRSGVLGGWIRHPWVWALAATLGCTPAGDPGDAGIRHVLLVSIDTLRADHCSVYGYPKPTTPFLEELGALGVVFENHMVNSNNTLSSHASILTGLVPMAHGTYDNLDGVDLQALAPSYMTVAERFSEAGFETAAFTTHPAWLGTEFGLDQGFGTHKSAWIDAPTNTRRFLQWFDATIPERMFAFLHYYDPHSETEDHGGELPYDSTPELRERFAGPAPDGFTGCLARRPSWCCSRYLHAVSDGMEELGPDHLEYLEGLYDAGIAEFDERLRELFRQLRRRGILDETLIVITSDHGEEFMEHGRLLHGSAYDEIMHVPLIVILPESSRPAPRRVAEITRSIDIAPTLMELCGLPRIGQGQSLAPTIVDGTPPMQREAQLGSSVLRGDDGRSLYKLLERQGGPAFYDLDRDPGEQVNLGDTDDTEERGRIELARARLKALRDEARRISSALRTGDEARPELDEDALEALRSLGYVE